MMQSQRCRQSGFTLIELGGIIVILCIILAVVVGKKVTTTRFDVPATLVGMMPALGAWTFDGYSIAASGDDTTRTIRVSQASGTILNMACSKTQASCTVTTP